MQAVGVDRHPHVYRSGQTLNLRRHMQMKIDTRKHLILFVKLAGSTSRGSPGFDAVEPSS